MAKFQQIYNADGSYEEHLFFAGKEYIFRRFPFKNGISQSQDHDIFEQVEADHLDLINLEEICNKISDMTDGFEDGQTVIPWLTAREVELEKERN